MFRHIHIVACSPRSGTTLLHEAMATCFRVDKRYDHEIRFDLVDAVDGAIALSKRPLDARYMPSVIDLNERLFVIYVVRDPRDVISSRHHRDPNRYFSNIGLWREMHAAGRKLSGHARFLEIRYEVLVSRPDEVQASIARWLPWLAAAHAFSDYHLHAAVPESSRKAMRGVRPIAPTSVGIWKDHLPRIKGQQQRYGSLTPDLVALGYEASADWERALDGIRPDRSPSYLSEVGRLRRLWGTAAAVRRASRYRRKLRPPRGKRRRPMTMPT
jgi:hypothetical protein